VPKEDTGVKFIKRVVAGSDDEIYVKEGHVYRKAAGKATSVRVGQPGVQPPCADQIPAGHGCMMGDNRGESDDSRFYGPVPTAWIVGTVTQVHKPAF
jgi:signal peptidase I